MSTSMFSVSKLLGKGRKGSKRGPPSISSVSTEKEKGKKSSLLARATSGDDEQFPGVTTSTFVAEPFDMGTASEKEKVAATSTPPTSSIEIPPATAEEAKGSLPATDPTPPEIPTSIDNANKEDAVEEHGYAMVQQPEARNSPSDWSDIHHETANGAIDSLSEPQQKQESEAATKAIEDALKAAQSELDASQRAFSDLQVAMQNANNTIDDLKKERDQIQSRAEVEKGELLDEVGRLKGIIGLERQEREERIEGLEREIDELRGRVSQQSATIDQLQENLAYSQEENRNLDIENEGLNTTLMEHQDYIGRLEEKIAEEEEEVKGVEGKIQELETQVIRCEQGFEKARNLVTEKENHLKMVEMNNNNLSSQLAHLRTNLATTERENRMAMDQLRRQSNELQKAKGTAVQPNLNVSRSIINGPRQARIENAITAVKLLNEEVFQTAAAITDQLEYVPKRFVADDHGGSAKAEVLKATLGLELVTKLTKEASFSSETYNPFFLQMALQGCLIASCMRITTSWYPAEWEYANFLFVLYERIRGTGGPDIAMHWRNATQQCCYPSSDRNSRLVSSLVEQIMIVLTVCGWSKDSAAEETLRQKFTLNLTDIVSQALRLNSLTTAGPTGEVEAVLIEPGQTFDSQRMVNDCPFESDAGTDQAPKFPPEDEIVCTTALGLKWADSTGDESDQVLLKPKVVLNGALW